MVDPDPTTRTIRRVTFNNSIGANPAVMQDAFTRAISGAIAEPIPVFEKDPDDATPVLPSPVLG